MINRWATLGSNVALETACGTSYAFSVYSDQLKNTTGFTQKQMNSIASIGNVGLYLAIVAGVVFDKKGPKPTLLTGVILSTLGYVLMWAAAAGHLGTSGATVGWYSLYMFMWSNGSAWYDTVAISTNVRNFPNDRGRIIGTIQREPLNPPVLVQGRGTIAGKRLKNAVYSPMHADVRQLLLTSYFEGLLKSFFGLSASVVTVFYSSLFKERAAEFLLFLGIFTGGIGLLCTFSTALVPVSQAVAVPPRDSTVLNLGMLFLLILGIYVLTIAVVTDQQPNIAGSLWTSMVMIPLLLLQAVVIIPACRKGSTTPHGKRLESTSAVVAHVDASAPLIKKDSVHYKRQPDKVVATGASIKEICSDFNFWLLSFVVMCGTGAGLTFINNLGQQVKSLAGTSPENRPVASDAAAVHVVVLSVANCLGRIVWGYCSDRFPRVTRIGWLTTVTALTTVAMLLSSLAPSAASMYGVTSFAGFCYGGYWALMPSILADIWGTKWFAAMYSMVSLFPALGGYIFSVEMAGTLYDSKIDRAAGETECYGIQCYELTFQLLAAINAVGTMGGVVLWWRTKTLAATKNTGSISSKE